MKQGRTGTHRIRTIGEERISSFIPSPLPPKPSIDWGGALHQALEAAIFALGRLDGVVALLPDPNLFLYTYLRKEAVLSSQIEGSQSSLSDLLRYELDESPGVPRGDAEECSCYIRAIEYGLKRLEEGFPLSNRLLRDIHSILLSNGRGRDKMPGHFRSSQNWIGGTRPGNAHFVPPPPTELAECMGNLESFLHAKEDGLPTLVRAGLAHVQFETIHPFLDGNGRMGRMLITLLFCHTGILRTPLLYLSLFLKQNRGTYYELLDNVRLKGDWETWLAFFFKGIQVTADDAVSTYNRISQIFTADINKIETNNLRIGSALRVHEALMFRPITTIAEICKQTNLTFPTVSATMGILVDLQIASEITGRTHNRIFAYDHFISVLAEGTEIVRSL